MSSYRERHNQLAILIKVYLQMPDIIKIDDHQDGIF
jgi:hypothetical protein